MTRDIDTLIVAQAVMNVAGARTSTKDPDNLRGRVDARYREMFEQTGAKTFDLNLNGKKVGTYSISVTKPSKQTILKVADRDAFTAWCKRNGFMVCEPDIERATRNFDETGELPDGCSAITIDDPGGEYKLSTLKVNEHDVNEALGGTLLPALLMEGGES